MRLWPGMGAAAGLLILLCGCVCVICYEEDHLGRVIDAETREPIEGAVVLGTWYSIAPGPGGGTQNYYDAEETVTDKKGDFHIKGMGLKVLSTLDDMFILVFKAGYEQLGSGPWSSFKIDPILRSQVTWEGKRAIIPIHKMTEEKMRKSFGPSGVGLVPQEKTKRLREELDRHWRQVDTGKRKH